MHTNTITEIISELSRLEISDSKVAWQVRQLIDKLCLLEEVYETLDCHNAGLSLEEQKRYKEELFPNLLRHCRKTADYFAACPYIRYNEQNNEILSDCFTRYNKIVDRLIVKLQQNSCPANPFASAWSAFLSKVSRAAVNLYNFIDRTLEVFLCKLPIELFQLPFRRRTLVEYHRDTIDYVGNGYSLQPIQGLNLECA